MEKRDKTKTGQSLVSLDDKKDDLYTEVSLDKKKDNLKKNVYFKRSKYIAASQTTASPENSAMQKCAIPVPEFSTAKSVESMMSKKKIATPSTSKDYAIFTTPHGKGSEVFTSRNMLEKIIPRSVTTEPSEEIGKPWSETVFSSEWEVEEVVLSGLKIDRNGFRCLLPKNYINDIIIDAFTSLSATKHADTRLLNFSIHHVRTLIHPTFNDLTVLKWC